MYVLGLDKMQYFSYQNDADSVLIEVKRDQPYIDELLGKAKEFMECLRDDFPPEITEKDYLFNEDPKWAVDCIEYVNVDTQIKGLEKERAKLKEKVLSGTDGGNMENDVVKVVGVNRKGAYDMEALAEHFKTSVEELDLFRKRSSYYQIIKPKKTK